MINRIFSTLLFIPFFSLSQQSFENQNLDSYLKLVKYWHAIPLDFVDGEYTLTDKSTNRAKVRYNTEKGWPEKMEGLKTYSLSASLASVKIPLLDIDTLIFRIGFPKINKNDEKSLYQVIVDGKLKLLLTYVVEEATMTNYENLGQTTNANKYVFYLLDSKKQMIELKNQKSVLKHLSEKSSQITTFTANKNIKFKKWNDVVQILRHYNSL